MRQHQLQFSSDVAQVIAYSMAIAGLSGEADINKDGTVTLEEARTPGQRTRKRPGCALGPILGIPELTEYIAAELDAIVRLIASMDVMPFTTLRTLVVSRGYGFTKISWLNMIRKLGSSLAYYTPMSVVQFQVRIVDDLPRNKFNQRLGSVLVVITLTLPQGQARIPLLSLIRQQTALPNVVRQDRNKLPTT